LKLLPKHDNSSQFLVAAPTMRRYFLLSRLGRKGQGEASLSGQIVPGNNGSNFKTFFSVILNGVRDLKSLKMRDSSLRSE
jgi:hypothetical protein